MKLDITNQTKDKDEKLERYIHRKIKKLDKYIGSHAKKSAHAEIILREQKDKRQKCECEIIMHVPHDTIFIKEATINMYAAVDIAAETLKNRLRKYHELSSNHGSKVKRAARRLKRLFGKDDELV
jgi:ribosomal subunit interface protein